LDTYSVAESQVVRSAHTRSPFAVSDPDSYCSPAVHTVSGWQSRSLVFVSRAFSNSDPAVQGGDSAAHWTWEVGVPAADWYWAV
jgi:hypothetical protein